MTHDIEHVKPREGVFLVKDSDGLAVSVTVKTRSGSAWLAIDVERCSPLPLLSADLGRAVNLDDQGRRCPFVIEPHFHSTRITNAPKLKAAVEAQRQDLGEDAVWTWLEATHGRLWSAYQARITQECCPLPPGRSRQQAESELRASYLDKVRSDHARRAETRARLEAARRAEEERYQREQQREAEVAEIVTAAVGEAVHLIVDEREEEEGYNDGGETRVIRHGVFVVNDVSRGVAVTLDTAAKEITAHTPVEVGWGEPFRGVGGWECRPVNAGYLDTCPHVEGVHLDFRIPYRRAVERPVWGWIAGRGASGEQIASIWNVLDEEYEQLLSVYALKIRELLDQADIPPAMSWNDAVAALKKLLAARYAEKAKSDHERWLEANRRIGQSLRGETI